jgi:hypothetical protein
LIQWLGWGDEEHTGQKAMEDDDNQCHVAGHLRERLYIWPCFKCVRLCLSRSQMLLFEITVLYKKLEVDLEHKN